MDQTTYRKLENAKPCPFCGSSDITLRSEPFWNLFVVSCHHCYVQNRGYETEEEAVEAWNKRTGDETEAGVYS